MVVSEGENHCARGWWVHRVVGWVLGYFWGGQQARALYVEGAPGFFGSGRCAYDWTKGDRRREAEKERARQREIREKERPKSNVARFGRRGRGGMEEGRNHLPAYVMLHGYWTQTIRKNRSLETRNRLSVRLAEEVGSREPPSPPFTDTRKRVFS